MTDAESRQYVKAICEYMFFGTEWKLKAPVDVYFFVCKKEDGTVAQEKKQMMKLRTRL